MTNLNELIEAQFSLNEDLHGGLSQNEIERLFYGDYDHEKESSYLESDLRYWADPSGDWE